MRAAVTDRRLEAIAGAPLSVTSTPTYGPRGTVAFVVFVGLFQPATVQVAIQCRTGELPPQVNLNMQNETLSNSGTTLADVHPLRPDLLAASVAVNADNLGVGQGRYAQPWVGPWAAALYPVALSPDKAHAVALSLARSLSF